MKKNELSGPLLPRPRRDSGSALLTAMLFAFVVGVLSVAYLKLASSEYRSSLRSSLYASSLNLAESGVEMALASLNAGSVSGSIIADATTGRSFLADGGFAGDVRYVVLDASSTNPIIYAEGIISSNGVMNDVKKQVKVGLSSGFLPFEKGFSSRNGINFSGSNVLLDSYNSNYGPYNSEVNADGTAAGYGVLSGGKYLNKNDDIFVASEFLDGSGGVSVSVGNGSVFGFVQTGGSSTAEVKQNGEVTTYTGPDAGEHQPDRITSDFYADYPVTPLPTASYPRPTWSSRMTVITGSNDVDAPTYYDVSGFSLTGQKGLTISGHVVFVMSGNIRVNSSDGVVLDPTANATVFDNRNKGSSLTIYTADNVDIGGGGVTNAGGVPSDFTVIGTAEMDGTNAGQTIKIAGNGVLAASVYAPNADVTVNGGGSTGNVFGGVVALTATIVGGGEFHFDEALRDIVNGGGTYTISSWLEMNGATSESTPVDLTSYF